MYEHKRDTTQHQISSFVIDCLLYFGSQSANPFLLESEANKCALSGSTFLFPSIADCNSYLHFLLQKDTSTGLTIESM